MIEDKLRWTRVVEAGQKAEWGEMTTTIDVYCWLLKTEELLEQKKRMTYKL